MPLFSEGTNNKSLEINLYVGSGIGAKGEKSLMILVWQRWLGLCGSGGREFACSGGDLGSIHGSGRSSGEGNGNPLQDSCLGNPVDRGAWQELCSKVEKSETPFHASCSFMWLIVWMLSHPAGCRGLNDNLLPGWACNVGPFQFSYFIIIIFNDRECLNTLSVILETLYSNYLVSPDMGTKVIIIYYVCYRVMKSDR